jgi:acyl-CoA thioesterase I
LTAIYLFVYLHSSQSTLPCFREGLHAPGTYGVASCLGDGAFRWRQRAPLAGRGRRDRGLLPDPHPGRRPVRPARRATRRWTDGVTALRGDCVTFASHWQAHNYRILTETGPLWVVLGDSTGQGLGAPSPEGGYVGQALAGLRLQTGRPWRVLNLSVSGALIRDVLHGQLSRLPAGADLVTCGIGVNDILYSRPARLLRDLRILMGAIPDETVVLDLPLPTGIWGLLGRISVPYVARINRTIHETARARGLPVAEVSAHFLPPWAGKFASDSFHPSQAGYRDWTRALLAAVPATAGHRNLQPDPAA